jgi:hypothetical protein
MACYGDSFTFLLYYYDYYYNYYNVLVSDLSNSIQHFKFLFFADDLKIFRMITSPRDCLLLRSDVDSVSDWCAAISMRLNSHKTRVMMYSRKTNVLCYDYRRCRSAIARTTSIKDLGVFFDSKLYFHNHVDFLFSECSKILGLIRSITFRFSSLDCRLSLYTALVSQTQIGICLCSLEFDHVHGFQKA